MTSIKEIIANHINSFREGNIEKILGDYSEDAILFTPKGALKGRQQIGALFEGMVAEFAQPGTTEQMHVETYEGDYAYFIWSAETADNIYEMVTDTFFIRGGKIAVQSFAAKITPKAG